MVSMCEPSLPHTTGPIPDVGLALTTAAPAPSPNKNAMPRSCGSMKSVIFSDPITTTWRALPPRTASLATASAYANPAQAALTSIAPALTAPRRSCTALDPAWCLVGVRAGRQYDQVDVGRRDARRREGLTRCTRRHVDYRLIGGRVATGDDAAALANPRVGRIDVPADFLVGHDARRPVLADRDDASSGRTGL